MTGGDTRAKMGILFPSLLRLFYDFPVATEVLFNDVKYINQSDMDKKIMKLLGVACSLLRLWGC